MKKLILTVFLGSLMSAASAQFTYDYLRAADNYYSKQDYYSAAQYYEKYLATGAEKGGDGAYNPYAPQGSAKTAGKKSGSREQAVYNLAESYRKLNYHVKAEPVYQEVVNSYNDKFPLARYHYAASLRALAKYQEAESQITAFLNEYTTNDSYREAAQRELANLRFIRAELGKKDLNLYSVNKAAGAFNGEGANYAPAITNDGMLMFTSTRADSSAKKTSVHNNRIYKAAWGIETGSEAVKLAIEQPDNMHQGAVTVSPDGNTIYFTRWEDAGESKSATLYSSRMGADGWSEPVMLSDDINMEGYNSQQPFVMPDGKYLLFSSNRPGGQGGFDIWMAELDGSGNAGTPVNLGKNINTSFDEEAPSYHAASRSLVFSSNGRVGMGGFDFFYSKGSPGNWSEPVNFGYPVNSIKDDLYFTSRGTERNILEDVILSSDRDNECCLELYSLSKQMPDRRIYGMVVDCETNQPIPGSTVEIIDTVAGRTILDRTTGADGSYELTIPEYQPLKVTARAEGYYTKNLHFYRPSDPDMLTLENPVICLSLIPEIGTKEVLDNVYYAFNKAVVLEESYAALDKLYKLLDENPTLEIEISGHTDNLGSDDYNMKLSQARAQSVVDYLVGKGISLDRLKAVGYGESQPIAPNQNPDGSDNPEGREKNRRTEFKILNK